MIFAILGPITFSVIGSPEALKFPQEYKFSKHEVAQARPKLQWLAQDLQQISLTIKLHQLFKDELTPAQALIVMRSAASAHRALPLVFANGVHRGWFVITKLTETAEWLSAQGDIIAATVELELLEWTSDADADLLGAPPKPDFTPVAIIPGAAAAAAAGATIPGVITTSPTGAQVVSFSAPNAGVSALSSNPAPAPPPAADPFSVSPTAIVRMAA